MNARLPRLEWDLLIAAAKDVPIEDELARRGIQLKREGDELIGPCPICCDGTDRFAANTRKGVFNCRVCKAKGDVVHFVQHIEGVGRREAAEMLTDHDRPRSAPVSAPTKPQRPDAERTQYAVDKWFKARPSAGTLIEKYLPFRGITISPPLTLRFAPRLWHKDPDTGIITFWPAMIGIVVRGVDNVPIAIHRTYLAQDGNGKAPITPKKMALGPWKGGCIRLAAAIDHVMISEGIETGLAAMELAAMQGTPLPAWSAVSAGGIEALNLPDNIKCITILADNDTNGRGEAAARNAAGRWQREGRIAKIARPPAGIKDFADWLVEIQKKKVACHE